MKQKTLTKKKVSPSPFNKGDYTGIHDKLGHRIKVGDVVRITVGKPNNGYLVTFEAGAFCFTGGQVGTCSFIKFRDELISGMITGKPDYTNFEEYLLIVDVKPDALAPVIQPNYNRPTGSGGIR